MGSRDDSDVDDDFSDLYKEYTRPPRSNTATVPETAKPSERSHAGFDEEEEEPFDPNAVPAGLQAVMLRSGRPNLKLLKLIGREGRKKKGFVNYVCINIKLMMYEVCLLRVKNYRVTEVEFTEIVEGSGGLKSTDFDLFQARSGVGGLSGFWTNNFLEQSHHQVDHQDDQVHSLD
nr:hypothetical protein [Tanacetum cinerariifolium]